DLHVHFRDPGLTHKEDIITGSHAAAAGGVTTALCMPNTKPVIDSLETIKYVFDRAKDADIEVLPYAAVTVGQKGEELTDHEKMRSCGAAALSDDGIPIQSADVMRRALISAKKAGMLIVSHCEYADMVHNYAVNEGKISEALGLPGRPAIAEELMASRDMALARDTGSRVHIAHVSAKGTVEAIRRAKKDGIAVTAETCPQYFTATEELVLQKGALARVNPPLRTEEDRRAIIEGLLDGTLDAISTDHAPHAPGEKDAGLEKAPSGMVGLETSLALAITVLAEKEGFSLDKIISLMSVNPSHIAGLDRGSLAIGRRADIVLFDPCAKWVVDPEKLKSKSHNTPFGGMEVTGRVKMTISAGKIVYRDN
ncbi:MAG: dihydroorotase, partial [Oscillospiraceae bacterium]|nr:dihydroorotase [Oscillospiraceae bacterium]